MQNEIKISSVEIRGLWNTSVKKNGKTPFGTTLDKGGLVCEKTQTIGNEKSSNTNKK